jgi:Flp pilus assembly protein TadD
VVILRKSIATGSADADIHYLLAESLLRTSSDDPPAALREVNLALKLDADHVAALLLRAKLILKDGSARPALADLEKARTLDPENRGVLYTLGRAYQQSGRTAQAKELFASFLTGRAGHVNKEQAHARRL